MTRGRISSRFREKIISGIRTGRYAEGEYIGTARMLADEYHVTWITANRTLAAMAAEGLVKRSRGTGTFIARESEKRCRRCYRIGLCFHDRFTQFVPEFFTSLGFFARYAEYSLHRQGHSVQYVSFESLHQENFGDLGNFDGILAATTALDQDSIPLLLRKSIPVVSLAQTFPEDIPFHQVIPDLPDVFYKAAVMIKAEGIRSIRILASEEENIRQRALIFMKAARWAGFSEDALHLVLGRHQTGDWGQLDGFQLAEQEVGAAASDTLFFCPSDLMSFGFLRFMQEKNMKPGKDFHLLSFDDLESEDFLPFGKPILSSIAFPKQKIVEEALKLLFQEIEMPDADRHILKMPCEIIIRNTFSFDSISLE